MLLRCRFLWELEQALGFTGSCYLEVKKRVDHFYAGCPIIWASKLQSQVALSTTEAEYIAISMSRRDVLPIMFLLKEMREQGFSVICTEPHVYCKFFFRQFRSPGAGPSAKALPSHQAH